MTQVTIEMDNGEFEEVQVETDSELRVLLARQLEITTDTHAIVGVDKMGRIHCVTLNPLPKGVQIIAIPVNGLAKER